MVLFGFWGCATLTPGTSANQGEAGSNSTSASNPSVNTARPVSRNFSAPTALDRQLDAKPQVLPAIKPASTPGNGVEVMPSRTTTDGSDNSFCIQVDALSDMDAAQAKKAELEKKLGEKIDVVFDAPYYKLRFGKFSSQQEAQDKLVDIAGKNVQGFVIRQ